MKMNQVACLGQDEEVPNGWVLYLSKFPAEILGKNLV